MRHFVPFFFLFCFVAASAQAVEDTTQTLSDSTVLTFHDSLEVPYQVMNDSIFEHLDLSQVPSNYLMDYGVELIELDSFPASNPDSANLLSYNKLMRMYGSFYTSAIDTNDPLLPHPNILYHRIDSFRESGQIPLMLLQMNYHQIKPTAIEDNLITLEGVQLHDVEGREENPYLQKTLVAGAATAFATTDSVVEFIIPDNLFFTNSEDTIEQIEVDLDDGEGYRTVTFNTPFSGYYPNMDGPRQLKILIRLLTSSGQVYIFHTSLTRRPPAHYRYAQVADETVDFPPTLEHWGGIVSIAYGCDDEELDKPFIVVPGFDPPALALLNVLQGEEDWEDAEAENYEGFLASLTRADLTAPLEEEGYDLVYIDYNHGADDLWRNAELVKEVIEWVNDEKTANGSDEQNVVYGESMGGLVARIALREMEDDPDAHGEHETAQFITMDSPHDGAYAPYGFQYMLLDVHYTVLNRDVLLGLLSPVVNLLEKDVLYSPAARQMLYGHVEPISILAGQLIVDENEHQTFQDELEALGYPQNVEPLAISSGSQVAAGQQYPPNDLLLDINTNSDALLLTAGLGDIGFFLAEFAGGVEMEYEVRGLPDATQGTREIYNGQFVRNILGILPMTISASTVEANSLRPYEVAPGGYYRGLQGMVPVGTPGINIPHDHFGFVPSVSALDVDNQAWGNNLFFDIQAANVVQSGAVPFARYTAEVTPGPADFNIVNHGHVNKADDYVVDFLIAELLPQAPDFTTAADEFNFGDGTTDRDETTDRMEGITIGMNDMIAVNADLPVGDQSQSPLLSAPAQGSQFSVFTSPLGCGGPATVTLDPGGELTLGENATGNVGNLTISSGSELIMNGGLLHIADGSTLIIEEGATLTFNGGTIELDGDNAVLEIRGTLAVGDNVTFTFQGGSTGHGFVRFVNDDWPIRDNVVAGQSSFIHLSGSGKTDKILEIDGVEGLRLPVELDHFHLENGLVEAGISSRINVSCRFMSYNVRYTSIESGAANRWRGIHYYDNSSAPTIQYSDFDNAEKGIWAFLNTPTTGNIFNLSNCTFTNCLVGLEVSGGTMNVVDSDFDSNEDYSIDAYAMTGTNTVSECSFSNGSVDGYGIAFTGSTGSIMDITCCDIIDQNVGVHMSSSKVRIKDSDILQNPQKAFANEIGIHNAWGSFLDLADPFGSVHISSAHPIDLTASEGAALHPQSNPNVIMLTDPNGYHVQGNVEVCSEEYDLNVSNNYWQYTQNGVQTGLQADYVQTCNGSIVQGGGIKNTGNAALPISYGTNNCTGLIVESDSGGAATQSAGSSHSRGSGLKPDTMSFSSLAALLLQNGEKSTSVYEHSTLQQALQRMLVVLEDSIKNNPKLQSSPMASMALQVADSLVARTSGKNKWTAYSYLFMRGALARTTGNLSQAFTILDSLRLVVPAHMLPAVQKWYCVVNAEYLIDQKLASQKNLDSLMQDCSKNNPGAPQPQKIDVTTSLTEEANVTRTGMKVYPNPATDALLVEFEDRQDVVKVELLDLTGKVIQTTFPRRAIEKIEINVSGLSSGVYLLHVQSSEKAFQQKVLIAR